MAGANDLTTLDAAKGYLRLEGTNVGDDIIESLITSVSAFIETYTNRVFAETDYEEVRDGIGCFAQRMAFANYPVSAVSAVTIDGVAIPAAASFNDTGYRFDSQIIVLNGYSFSKGNLNVTLSYTAGYSTIPYDLAQACNELVGLRYREMERIGQVSKIIQGENVTFSKDAMPADVLLTLNQYRKVILV